jgi:predicted nucleic acid-binding protein
VETKKERRPIDLRFSRIYLDTNILIAALLESDSQWRRKNPKKARQKSESIHASSRIFREWECRANALKTSTFAIGEFVGAGSRFGKTTGEMLRIVNDKILKRCKLCEPPQLRYEKDSIPPRMRREIRLTEVRCSGPRDKNGTPIGGEFVFMVTLDLRLAHMLSGAGPKMLRPLDLSRVKVEKIESYSAPGYELMLFHKASELANKYDLGLADALHLLYVQGQAEFIITDDVRTFVKRWEENPQFKRESGVAVWTSKRMLERAKRLRWL